VLRKGKLRGEKYRKKMEARTFNESMEKFKEKSGPSSRGGLSLLIIGKKEDLGGCVLGGVISKRSWGVDSQRMRQGEKKGEIRPLGRGA